MFHIKLVNYNLHKILCANIPLIMWKMFLSTRVVAVSDNNSFLVTRESSVTFAASMLLFHRAIQFLNVS